MANQVNVELVEIPFSNIPGDITFQLNYQENLNATTETASVANEANREAENANTRNNEQDQELAAQAETIKTTQEQLSNALTEVGELSEDVVQVTQDLTDHVNSNSQHGVTGDNVIFSNNSKLKSNRVIHRANIRD